MKRKAKFTSLVLLILAVSIVLSGCLDGKVKNVEDGVSNNANANANVFESNGMIAIRLQPTNELFDETLDALLKIPGACDEVWLTCNFHRPLAEISSTVEALKPAVAKIEAAGLRVVFEANVLERADNDKGDYSYKELVGSDGKAATNAYCPAGAALSAQMNEAIKLFAALKPYAIYLGDDLSLDSVKYGCFCDTCVKQFNNKNGVSYTTSTVVRAILQDVNVRAKYIDMNKRHLAELAGGMAKAAMTVYKDIYIGVETCYLTNYLGDNINPIFKAIHDATNKAVFVRPGGGYYNDHNAKQVFDKVLNNSWAISLLPDYVEIRRHEIENASYTALGKSLGGTLVEASLGLAYGANSLSFSICGSDNEPISTREAMWRAMAKYRNYWQGLIDDQVTADGEKTGVAGLRFAYFSDMWKIVVAGDSATKMFWANTEKEAGRTLIDIGVPLTYEDDFCGAYLLHPDIIDDLTDDNIKFLLTQNVYTDGLAIKKLIARGFGDQLPSVSTSGSYSEVYTDHEANGRCAGLRADLDSYAAPQRQTFTLKSNCVALAHYTGTENVSSVLIKTNAGSTWVADGLDLWTEFLNGVRRSRISIVAQYLSGDMIPARLESDDRVALIVRAEKDGTFVSATLQNATIGKTYPIVVAVKADETAKFTFSRPGYEDVACPSEYKNGEHLVSVPVLGCWETGTLRIAK